MTRGRRWLWITVVALVLGTALVIGLLPVAVERAVVAWLHARGLDATLHVQRPGLRGVHISELRLGREPALEIHSLDLEYSAGGLMRGRLDTLRASGVTLRAEIGGDGALSLGELDALRPQAASDIPREPPGAPALLPRSLDLEDLELLVATPRGGLRVEGAARLSLGAAGVDALQSSLRLSDDAGDLGGALELGLDGAGALGGSLRLEASSGAALEALLPALAGLESASLEAALTGSVSRDEERLTLRVPECARLRLGPGALPGGVRLPREHALCLRTPEEASLLLDASRGVARLQGPLEIEPLEIALRDAESRALVRGTTPRILVTQPGETSALAFATSGGDLELPGAGLELQDVELRTAFDPAADAPLGEVAVSVARLRHTAEPPEFEPLALRARARYEAGRLDFRGTLSDLTHPIELRFDGQHDLAVGRGRAELRLPALHFARDGVQPRNLSPRLAGLVESLEGDASASGTLQWSGSGAQASLELSFDPLSLASRYANVKDASGTLRFESLAPLRTAGSQSLRFGRLEAGVALTDGSLTFALDPDAGLRIESAEGHLAGGLLRAQGVLDFADASQRLRFQLRQLDLSSLLVLADVEGLSGTGVLTGEIPLRGEQGRLVISGGRLEASAAGGVIRYRPAVPSPALEAAGSGGALLVDALREFRYERLRASIDGDLAEEVQAVVELFGSSPNVEGGRPIEFTLRLGLTGTLRELLRASDLTRWIAAPTSHATPRPTPPQGAKP